MKTFFKMLKIEGRLSVQDMNMPIFSVVMPAVVLILLGIILGNANQPTDDFVCPFMYLCAICGGFCSAIVADGGGILGISNARFGTFFGGWLLVLVSILSIGMLAGGVAKNSKSASVIASALYFPMLVFSGATLLYEVMPRVTQKVVDVFPLTQGIKILKVASLGEPIENVGVSVK